MKKFMIQFTAMLFLISIGTASAQSIRAGVSIADGQNSFYFAMGDYYHVPESSVIYIRDHHRKIHEEELPVVFFLASRARVDPGVIVDLRLGKRMSWLDITLHYGFTPEIFYVPVTRVGPPYGNAYGYYKKHKGNYKKVVLADTDVINLVNLRFISEYHHVAPELIMDRRGKGETFFVMNDDFRRNKAKYSERNDDRKSHQTRGENAKEDAGGNKGRKHDGDEKNNDRGKGRGRG